MCLKLEPQQHIYSIWRAVTAGQPLRGVLLHQSHLHAESNGRGDVSAADFMYLFTAMAFHNSS